MATVRTISFVVMFFFWLLSFQVSGKDIYSCSKVADASTDNSPCDQVKCIREICIGSRAKCVPGELAITFNEEADLAHLGDDPQPYTLACACDPVQVGDAYTCPEVYYDYSEENPCTAEECTQYCKIGDYSSGQCLDRDVILVPRYPGKEVCCCDVEIFEV